MLNRRNGYTKIGYSMNPVRRERTFQAEDPDVVLLMRSKPYLDGVQLEKTLHRKFAPLRLRGEWFNLAADDYYDLFGDGGLGDYFDPEPGMADQIGALICGESLSEFRQWLLEKEALVGLA